jgi:acylaminoacyl-peptidase
MYKGMVLRNPVLDLIGNEMSSDIPDWSYFESGLPYAFECPKYASISELEHLRMCSPSSVVQQVKVPTLIMVGVNDRRVPYLTNAVRWYEILRSNHVPVQ